jgi:hypothetical protein
MTLRQINPDEIAVKAPHDGLRVLAIVAVAIAAACALPMLAVMLAALVGGTDTVRHLIMWARLCCWSLSWPPEPLPWAWVPRGWLR